MDTIGGAEPGEKEGERVSEAISSVKHTHFSSTEPFSCLRTIWDEAGSQRSGPRWPACLLPGESLLATPIQYFLLETTLFPNLLNGANTMEA